MKLVLKSDFRDYYDHWFDSPYLHKSFETFERFSVSGMNRIEMLNYLDSKAFKTPCHGVVKNLNLSPDQKVVVYTDINAHRAEGKILCTFEEALDNHITSYCSKYVESSEPGTSLRILRVGKDIFSLKYKSDTWMSNKGNVDIILCGKNTEQLDEILPNRPLLAVDFVRGKEDDVLYAIDLNISPGLHWTGVNEELKAKEVVSNIKKYIKLRIKKQTYTIQGDGIQNCKEQKQ